jgi:hypothetical protein
MRTKDMIRKAAGSIVRRCLQDQPGGFTAQQILEDTAALAAYYHSPNALRTALGAGVRGTGLGLHRDRQGAYLRCRENGAVALLEAELSEEELAALATELGFADLDGLVEAIDRLPPASPDPSV